MTVLVTTNKIRYEGNGVTTSFSFPFKVLSDSDLLVILIETATGNETPQEIDTHYTVTYSSTEGGTVEFITPPASGFDVFIKREAGFTQPLAFPTEANIPEKEIEKAFDRMIMLLQQVDEALTRAVLLGETSTVSGLTLPAPEAGKALVWNEAESGFQNSVDVFDDILPGCQAAQTAAEAAATAAEAAKLAAEVAAAAAAASAGSIDPTTLPTAGQKAAMAGTYGTPGAANKFVTDTDPRIGDAVKFQGIDIDTTAPTDGQFLRYDADLGKWVPSDGLQDKICVIKHTEPMGTTGWFFPPNITWNQRKLNTYTGDTSFITKISDYIFELEAGTYFVTGQFCAHLVQYSKSVIYNNTDSVVALSSTAGRSHQTAGGNQGDLFCGTFTITSAKQFTVFTQHLATVGNEVYGLSVGAQPGWVSIAGDQEVHAQLAIFKRATP